MGCLLLLISCSGFIIGSQKKPPISAIPHLFLPCPSAAAASGNDTGGEPKRAVDIDSISDAEALLACRAYLQRRKRWGPWVKADARKDMRGKFLGSLEEERSTGGGFFWEDPSQLKYLNRNSDAALGDDTPCLTVRSAENSGLSSGTVDNENLSLDDEDDFDETKDEEEIWESVKLQGSMGRRDFLPLVENDRLLCDAAEEFSPFFDAGPSEEHVRRSEAAKRTWSDEEWKQRWYEKRWGGRQRPMSLKTKKQKRIETRLRQLYPSVLENEALAQMSEEEIAEAIHEYVRLGDRSSSRSEARKTSETPSALDVYAAEDNSAQREMRQKRSERARKAYQTRLQNQKRQLKKKQPKDPRIRAVRPKRFKSLAKDDSPQASLRRVEDCLNDGFLPSISDVKSMLKPSRLSRRRDVLVRVLSDGFGLRGKCVPPDLDSPWEDQDPTSFRFASTAPIPDLGNFILHKLNGASGAGRTVKRPRGN